MKLYDRVEAATFLARPNRFLADVSLRGETVRVHVKNTGRCRELLRPGAAVWLAPSDSPGRKTPADLVAVTKPETGALVNIDSTAPNLAAGAWLRTRFETVRPEYAVGGSRFDFLAERGGERWLIEVKGCTLERDGLALFPDAPTLRGAKHLRELTALTGEGWRCGLLVVIAMGSVTRFSPNRATDPAFADALAAAGDAGVALRAMECAVTPDSLTLRSEIPIFLT